MNQLLGSINCFFLVLALVFPGAARFAPPGRDQAAQANPGDWPMYMHDAAHTGRTSASAFTARPLYLQWAYAFGERVEVEAQPVMTGGVIYQGAMNGEMHAINALTGQKIWIAQAGGPIAHTAAVSGGRVYYGSLDGSVYALEASTGGKAWSFATGGPVVSAPAVVDGVVYIGSDDGSLYALDAATGAKVWSFATGGPVVSSPAVRDGRVYFGSEDLKARAVDASSGAIIWETQLYGQGMHNTYPVLSDDGQVAIFQTVKPGATSYVPVEGYPSAPVTANPVDTWNDYYQDRPKTRTLYYLKASSGADLWNPAARAYVPMPVPYWGLLSPVLGPDGSAWFPAPSGAVNASHDLDHDDRLFKTDLATGQTTMVAGGPGQPEFQTRPDETGRMSFAGNDYLYTTSEDLSVFHPGADIQVLFGDGLPGQYNISTHMNPLGPLPDLHLWRYGGAIAMGGVPGGSVPVAGNGMIYYSAYGWLYAVGQQDKGLNPATSFPSRDSRAHELTYPRAAAPTVQMIQAEIEKRVTDLIGRGADDLPLSVRWEQPGNAMLYNEFSFEVYGLDYDVIRALAEVYPYLPASQQQKVKDYVTTLAKKTVLDPDDYAYVQNCIVYGEPGIQTGDVCKRSDVPVSAWTNSNPNLVGQRLFAVLQYARITSDWAGVKAAWAALILPQFQRFIDGYDPSLGFVRFEEWETGRLNLPAQVLAAQAVRDMAIKLGDTAAKAKAQALLNHLLDGRVAVSKVVPHLYDAGKITPAPLRLNPDGTFRYEDIMGPNSPYNAQLVPYSAALRDRATDPSQVNWWDGANYRVDACTGFMQYQTLVGYVPASAVLSARLRASLPGKTGYYVKSFEVNDPWWWMADLSHATTCGGEHLYTSPALSWSLFQVKAKVLGLKFDDLGRQLPEPVSFNAKYDLYRLQNLATLMKSVP